MRVRMTQRSLVAGLFTSSLIPVLAGMLACTPAPVEWDDVRYPATPPAVAAEPVVTPPPGPICPGSLHTALADVTRPKGDTYAVWWRVRPDSSAILMAAHSPNGGKVWDSPVAADTLDVSRRGCNRPAPAMATDTNGYVHFTYFLEAREGPGIFFTHSMRGTRLGVAEGVFHAPVVIVYGDKPAESSVAAIGDTVAVAYEDPNSERPQIALALSRTTGHLFEARVPVSSPSLPAVHPRVQFGGPSGRNGRTITVIWEEHPDSVSRGGRVAMRTGRWR